jgi:hypothetical protein
MQSSQHERVDEKRDQQRQAHRDHAKRCLAHLLLRADIPSAALSARPFISRCTSLPPSSTTETKYPCRAGLPVFRDVDREAFRINRRWRASFLAHGAVARETFWFHPFSPEGDPS